LRPLKNERKEMRFAKVYRFRLKHPHIGVVADFVPPPETNQNATADVLDRPEIELFKPREKNGLKTNE
jgi:hypothetical protein